MVTRCLLIASMIATSAFAQPEEDSYVKTWVERVDVQAEKPFRLFVEVSGDTISEPTIPKSDDLVVDVNNPQTLRRSITVRTPQGVKQQNILKYSFFVWATKEGQVTIPPIPATVNGTTMESQPIRLTVSKADPADLPDPNSVRLWVDRRTVTKGERFWIYLEATGFDVRMPETLKVDDLYINQGNMQQSISSGFARSGVATYKRGYYARAERTGEIEIPPIEMMVSGRPARSNSLSLTVVEGQNPPPPPVDPADPDSERSVLTEEDLVFIQMNVDKDTVYLGEPILLTTQLWQIIYPRISTGPYRGALNTEPTTEGFYSNELEPIQFETTRGPWRYNVTERRVLLYPTRVGELEIGAWHWEGIALINRQSITAREQIRRKLDQGPYTIKVNHLPDAPAGFSGAVGEFQVHSNLDSNAVSAGEPVTLSIIVRGQGNADAIGAPTLPKLNWAHVSDPTRDTRLFATPGEAIPSAAKTFNYTITPLRSGDNEIPAFDVTTFNSRVGEYEVATLGPYRINVKVDEDAEQQLLVPDNVALLHRSTDVQSDDIHPILDPPEQLSRDQGESITAAMALMTPVVAYIGLVVYMRRRRKLSDDVGYARARRAKHTGIRRLDDVFQSSEPADELFRTIAGYLGDKFNVQDVGMTSADVTNLLEAHEVDGDLVSTFEKIVRSCERARYASQALSIDEMRALVQASETAIHAFDDWQKRGGR